MCIILLAHRAHPEYTLILAANRDEFYERPTASAGFWEDEPQILAGRDLERGGTWLGVTKSGRIAAVTNYREPAARIDDAPSRGHLVSDFLAGEDEPLVYLSTLSTRAARYNGFNLIAGTPQSLYYYSNRGGEPREIGAGVHGLSNHLLDTPWPKVTRGREALSKVAAGNKELCVDDIFRVLADDAQAADAALPATGVGLELERVLSPVFIKSPAYGTRSSTVLLVSREGEVVFIERSFRPGSAGHEEVRYEFRIRSNQ